MDPRVRDFIPPIVIRAARKLKASPKPGTTPLIAGSPEDSDKLRWCPITEGPLTGRMLYMNPDARSYQPLKLNGQFDKSLFDFLDQGDWRGKVMYDIGAHIGYHTLNFAYRVGPEGHVYSFEPHPSHYSRIEINLSQNSDLASRVILMPVAIGNRTGRTELYHTETVEGGGSSASFIEGASTHHPRSNYIAWEYLPIDVEICSLDDLINTSGLLPPDMIKIDVEGAEGFVLEGSLATLRKFKPVILLEVHSPASMFHVTSNLLGLGYEIQILKEEEDKRCFLAAETPETNSRAL